MIDAIWSWEGGFGSSGVWGGIVGGVFDVITGAPNPFRYDGDFIFDTSPIPVPVVISEVPETWEELEELHPELFEPILETRPGLPPDPYPQDIDVAVTPEQEDEPMTDTWGHVFRDVAGSIITAAGGTATNPAPTGFVATAGTAAGVPLTPIGGGGGNGSCDGMAWSGAAPPKGYKVVNSCGVAVLRKVRRRRRRRMLTASDKSDIATIVGLVGKGQMASSLINRSAH